MICPCIIGLFLCSQLNLPVSWVKPPCPTVEFGSIPGWNHYHILSSQFIPSNPIKIYIYIYHCSYNYIYIYIPIVILPTPPIITIIIIPSYHWSKPPLVNGHRRAPPWRGQIDLAATVQRYATAFTAGSFLSLALNMIFPQAIPGHLLKRDIYRGLKKDWRS